MLPSWPPVDEENEDVNKDKGDKDDGDDKDDSDEGEGGIAAGRLGPGLAGSSWRRRGEALAAGLGCKDGTEQQTSVAFA